jgi:hypothetical protein
VNVRFLLLFRTSPTTARGDNQRKSDRVAGSQLHLQRVSQEIQHVDATDLRVPLLAQGKFDPSLTPVDLPFTVYSFQMQSNTLQSTQLESQIIQEDWEEYKKLRKRRLNRLSTTLTPREVEILDQGISMDSWEWTFLNYRDIRLFMS